ncbi:DAK2 domain-containing protein [Actinoplanes friuliensis]|uniref:Putative phosphatase n=1 Tax=Actinoplanes friuliensis DSM 7358 TaxID=1246995 RepID=U5W8S3_9ACTN|nr:DAK2 domain-containing protein [Actinoplanes friuliensis]AGZ45573.1 putative phosphatase [Actinoplanes friuliensis DSM 7358]
MLDSLDAAAVRRWCGGGLAALRAHQHEIDELNVYPVPDGDTGTNLVLTLTSAQQALDDSPALSGEIVEKTMRRMARGALLGARGNSGVIVSQILRGMADTFATTVAVRGGELARALRTATEAAYAAVARPVEGTVLSVVAAAAEGAGRIASDDLLAVARAAARSAAEALARTPQQLPILARAGVVDAGGRGLVLLLEALVEALNTTLQSTPTAAAPTTATGPASAGVPTAGATSTGPTSGGSASAGPDRAHGGGLPADVAVAGPMPGAAPDLAGVAPDLAAPDLAGAESVGVEAFGGAGDFGYEVQYLLDAEPGAVDVLRGALDRLGDSLVVVGTGEGEPPTWNVHVHVDDIGAAIEAGVVAGRPHRITVTRLVDRLRPHDHNPVPDAGKRAAVVVAAGDGLTSLFAAEGATVVGRNPSIAEMLAAIAATGAGRVVLLPNDANAHAVASSAAREATATGVRVSVVPTRSPVQALAALAVRDEQRAFDEDVIAMAEAAGACRYGEVCTAQREALTVAGRCRPGDLLGLVDGEVHVIGDDLEQVCRRLLDRMLGGGGELATLVLGADAPAELEDRLRGHVTQQWPFVELQSYAGGQPRYHLLVGVE